MVAMFCVKEEKGIDSKTPLAQFKTREDGNFRIRGLEKGNYAILLKSYNWILDHPVRVAAGTEDVDCIAKKALFLKAQVLDAETSNPVPLIFFDIQITDRKSGKKFEIGGACLNGNLQVEWIPKWRLPKIPFPVLIGLFSPDYFQHRETLYLEETLSGPPPTIFVEPIHRVPVLFRAVYKDGTPLEYPVLMVDFWKPGEKKPMGRAKARLQGKGTYNVRLPEGKNMIRVFRPMMRLPWPKESCPSGEWTVPGKMSYKVVFSKGAVVRLNLSPETMDSLKKGPTILWMEGTRKKKAYMEFGCQISPRKIKNRVFTIQEVPPGSYIRFALKESTENDRLVRATRLMWVGEGSELDFFL